MSLDSLTAEETKRIKEVVDAGEQVLSEVESLKEDLKEHVATLADELSVKPAVINKAIRLAYKQKKEGDAIQQAQQEMTDVEVILGAAGKV